LDLNIANGMEETIGQQHDEDVESSKSGCRSLPRATQQISKLMYRYATIVCAEQNFSLNIWMRNLKLLTEISVPKTSIPLQKKLEFQPSPPIEETSPVEPPVSL